MNESELPLLLRRRQVMKLLGVTNRDMKTLIEAGVLKPFYPTKKCKAFYKRNEVLKIGETE